jgi:1,4-alpha-glucan branching enzyme
MKKTILFLFFLISATLVQAQISVSPSTFEIDEQITITVNTNSSASDCNGLNNPTKVYMHSGAGDNSNAFGFDVVGNWGQDDGVGEMTSIGGGLFTISFTPSTYYNLTPQQIDQVTQLGIVFRNANGTQELKDNGCVDFFVPVGSFQLFLDASVEDQTVVSQGSNLPISATTSLSASFELFANGVSIDNSQSGTSFSTNYTISGNTYFELVATEPTSNDSQTATFNALTAPTVSNVSLPSGMEDGINYIDDNTAILVLYAPGKDYVYVAGSFNNYQPSANDAMNRDTVENKWWIQIDGLTPGQQETYEYWVGDNTPLANSPELVKVADPYSTLILSSFDDNFIPDSSYPNLPDFPEDAGFEVTVLETGQTPYNWQVTNFQKPKKEDLIVYEVLVRDFDANRNYQDLIDKIDYFKNLNINAIHLMPVMEYEGNESWGYNTSYHMALDKYYGTADKLKELIDLCHQNDIAVILDLVLNHAFGRSPMARMWMNDPDGDGFGSTTSENPYFNTSPTHSYNVGNDYNHQQPEVKRYTKRVIKQWVEEFKIDGFRWDLTKGFTQNCGSPITESCTNSFQQDRVDVLKEYADYSWSIDDTHYVIFEHLGQDNEEQQWANHRIGEGKGIMLWGKMTDQYNELTIGQTGNKSITRMGHNSRGFAEPRLLGYPESHDEERLMYKNVQFGNTSNSSHNVQNLNVALSRMSALGAVSVLVPGPKMIWHFGDLGMDNSIFTCGNGTVNLPGGPDGDCKLDTKPQPQWTENWLTDAVRGQIYEDWSKMHKLKTDEPVFEGDYTITSSSNNFTPLIDIFDISIPSNELRNVIVYSNFSVTSQIISTNFPGGVSTTWYDLMDPTGNTTYPESQNSITIPPGQFLILGNQPSQVLSIEDNVISSFSLYPNPSRGRFNLTIDHFSNVEIYELTGKRVKQFEGEFTHNDSFDISDLNLGMYMVRVKGENGRMMTTKLIKM